MTLGAILRHFWIYFCTLGWIKCIRGASLLKKIKKFISFFYFSPFSPNFAWRLWPGFPIDCHICDHKSLPRWGKKPDQTNYIRPNIHRQIIKSEQTRILCNDQNVWSYLISKISIGKSGLSTTRLIQINQLPSAFPSFGSHHTSYW
jgi:hypothetical protein